MASRKIDRLSDASGQFEPPHFENYDPNTSWASEFYINSPDTTVIVFISICPHVPISTWQRSTWQMLKTAKEYCLYLNLIRQIHLAPLLMLY